MSAWLPYFNYMSRIEFCAAKCWNENVASRGYAAFF